MDFLKKWARHASHAKSRRRAHLNVEALESRVVPYVTSGNAWPSPQLITISFVPDGTDLGGVSSNLFATFNAHKGWTTATWQNQILKAAQQWAQATNINFAVVSDDGEPIGGGVDQQGDPVLGDIRIGGYNFGTGDLGAAYMPPPVNNFSIAGDIQFNTGEPFNIGTTYDLFSVAMHEFGHALGLYHSTAYGAVMQAAYKMHSGLSSDDVAGIENIYSSNGPRTPDTYYSHGPNNSFGSAANISSLISPVLQTALVSNLDITTAGENEYFTFNAPSGTSSNLTVKVQSSGLSLLAPTLTVYNSSQTQIGYASGAGQYGTTLSVTVSGVTANQKFYVKVTGADTTALGTGAYALTLNFGTGASPTVPLPNTTLPDGNPLTSGGGTPLSSGVVPSIPGEENAGFDRFNPTEGSPVVDAASVSPKAVTPVAAPASPNLAALTVTAAGVEQSPAVVVVATPGTLISPAAGTVSTGISVTNARVSFGTIESGGGQNKPGLTALEDQGLFLPDEPAGTIPESPVVAPGQESLQGQTAAQWRAAATAFFVSENAPSAAIQQDAAPATAEAKEASPAFDPAAAASSFAIILGAFWTRPPEDGRARKRRSPRL
jgi:hypothetical protein